MSNEKHTPGPWAVNANGYMKVCAPNGFVLARVFKYGNGNESTAANARLIAAAPEMYAWLVAHYKAEEGPGETDRPAYAELRAILAKAGDGSVANPTDQEPSRA